MNQNFDKCFAWLMDHEGGYCDDAHDPGGMTCWGVTHYAWASWVGRNPTEDEMRGLTQDEVEPLYKARYWDKLQGDLLPSGVDYVLFDFSVNSGVTRAVKAIQRIVDTSVDGWLGPLTLAAIQAYDPRGLVEAVSEARQEFLAAIPTYRWFGKGWSRRVQEVRERALTLIC
jgi:lysozyme family protein